MELHAEILHGTHGEQRQLFLRAEGEELAALFADGNAISGSEVEGDGAGERERLARACIQRQRRLGIDRIELFEHHECEGSIDLENLDADVHVHLRAVERREMGRHPARGLDALRERQRLDPGLHLLGPDLKIAGRRGALRGHAYAGGQG